MLRTLLSSSVGQRKCLGRVQLSKDLRHSMALSLIARIRSSGTLLVRLQGVWSLFQQAVVIGDQPALVSKLNSRYNKQHLISKHLVKKICDAVLVYIFQLSIILQVESACLSVLIWRCLLVEPHYHSHALTSVLCNLWCTYSFVSRRTSDSLVTLVTCLSRTADHLSPRNVGANYLNGVIMGSSCQKSKSWCACEQIYGRSTQWDPIEIPWLRTPDIESDN